MEIVVYQEEDLTVKRTLIKNKNHVVYCCPYQSVVYNLGNKTSNEAKVITEKGHAIIIDAFRNNGSNINRGW